MKKLAALLVLVSISMFAIGCGEKKDDKPKEDAKTKAPADDPADTPKDGDDPKPE